MATAKKPTAKKPTAKKPTVNRPAPKKPTPKKPAATKGAAVKKVVANKPTPKKAVGVLSPAAHKELEKAFAVLEKNTFADRVARLTGSVPLTGNLSLPEPVMRFAAKAITAILDVTLLLATKTLDHGLWQGEHALERHAHRAVLALSGAAGGWAGLPGLAAELPLSTFLMLRRIADIARKNGEDLSDPATRLACIEVFAFGTREKNTDGTAYYAARFALHGLLKKAALELGKGGGKFAGSALKGVTAKVASLLGRQVTLVAAGRAVPAAGAASGAVLNTLFLEQYQSLAEAHFTVRRLERRYGADAVRNAYERLRTKKK